jgi:hypothetical protein
VRDGVPIMLIDQAETIDLDELKKTGPIDLESAATLHAEQNLPSNK